MTSKEELLEKEIVSLKKDVVSLKTQMSLLAGGVVATIVDGKAGPGLFDLLKMCESYYDIMGREEWQSILDFLEKKKSQ